MEKHYNGSNIFVLEYGAQFKSSQTCIAFFSIKGGSNFSKIFNPWEESK